MRCLPNANSVVPTNPSNAVKQGRTRDVMHREEFRWRSECCRVSRVVQRQREGLKLGTGVFEVVLRMRHSNLSSFSSNCLAVPVGFKMALARWDWQRKERQTMLPTDNFWEMRTRVDSQAQARLRSVNLLAFMSEKCGSRATGKDKDEPEGLTT